MNTTKTRFGITRPLIQLAVTGVIVVAPLAAAIDSAQAKPPKHAPAWGYRNRNGNSNRDKGKDKDKGKYRYDYEDRNDDDDDNRSRNRNYGRGGYRNRGRNTNSGRYRNRGRDHDYSRDRNRDYDYDYNRDRNRDYDYDYGNNRGEEFNFTGTVLSVSSNSFTARSNRGGFFLVRWRNSEDLERGDRVSVHGTTSQNKVVDALNVRVY